MYFDFYALFIRWAKIFFLAPLFFAVPTFAQVSSDSLGIISFLRLSDQQLVVYKAKVRKVASETGMQESILNKSPTVIAMTGLDSILRGDVSLAEKMADQLHRLSVERDGSRFYEFRWDYGGTWPYKLKAPWVSALSQGLALSLYTNLYLATGKSTYKKIADEIANSYLVTVDKGGFARWQGDQVILEEYPLSVMTAVLNGNAIAALSLSDYVEVFDKGRAFGTLLIGSKAFLEANIAHYTVTTKEYPAPVSAYSLAPQRVELLMRFVGGGLSVHQISLLIGDKRKVTLKLGGTNDHDTSSPAFIWLNHQYQNWGASLVSHGKSTRAIVAGQGQYDHAPFSFALSESELSEPLALEIDASNVDRISVPVQLYDGTVYHDLGSISDKSVPSKPERFLLPSSVLEVIQDHYRKQLLPIEPSYFSDNQLLIELLANRFDSPYLRKWAELMQGSSHFTPLTFDARSTLPWFIGEPKKIISPDLKDVEAFHTEYPSVISRDGIWYVFYSAIGVDNRWRIRRRISSDSGKSFSEASTVFEESNPKWPIKGKYAFPSVIWDRQGERYLMVFSGESSPGQNYNAIWISESTDLVDWSIPSLIMPEGGLDPTLWFDGQLFHILYTIVDGGRSYSLNEFFSTDLKGWSASKAVYIERSSATNIGLYTSTRLEIDGQEFFIVDIASGPARKEWRLLCRGNDHRLYVATDEVLARLGREPSAWDAYKYGMVHFKSGEDDFLLFNGMPLDSELSGSIGIVKVDFRSLAKFKSSPQCNTSN